MIYNISFCSKFWLRAEVALALSIFPKGSEEMKVKFTLNNGQAFTTRITYGFESTSDLADHLSRALGQATSDSVVNIETKNRVFLARPNRHCFGRNPKLKGLAPAEGALINIL